MRALRKGQARPWCLQPGIRGEVRLVERAFGIGPSALTEAMHLSEGTVKQYVSQLFNTLGIDNRVHAAITAYRHGLIT
ncbi:hypothetical protein BUW94_12060 [Corynebacterium diphtheriae]|nr:hypothetical protein BUW94_12060 [Corynebacterium diphtheriae]